MSAKTMIVREATRDDIVQLVDLRMLLFAEVGAIPAPESAPELRTATTEYFTKTTETGQTKSWIVDIGGKIIAVGSIAEFQRPPYPENISGREAYLLNMYTLPAQRRKGIANQIMAQILAFAKQRGYGKVWLHASPEGRSLYENYGFKQNLTEMEWEP